MKYFLFDKWDSTPSFLARHFGEDGVDIVSPKASRAIVSWLRGAWQALSRSSCGDEIVCWFDFQGVVAWWLGRLTFRRRNIYAINLMLKDKPTRRNRVAKWLYRKALLSGNFHASVTSEAYGRWINRLLGIEVKYALVPDLYRSSYADVEAYAATVPEERTVFCGGRNGRDWGKMLRIAALMPDVKFVLAMPGDVKASLIDSFTPP